MNRFIRGSVMAAPALALTMGVAFAKPVNFHGGMTIESLTSACPLKAGASEVLMETVTLVCEYQPAGLGSNGDTSGLSCAMSGPNGTPIGLTGYLVDGALTQSLQAAATQSAMLNRNHSLKLTKYGSQIGIVQQMPATLLEDTKVVLEELQIDNFVNVEGCSAHLIGVLVNK